jgi:hypothetical protein
MVASSAAFRGPLIYTHHRIDVIERWKGVPGTVVEAVTPGGKVGNLAQTFSGSPSLSLGTEYLLFLWTGKQGLTHVIGLSQGVFRLERTAAGEVFASRPGATELMLDAGGREIKDSAVRMNLREMNGRVKRALATGASR